MTENDNHVNAPYITLQALIETSFDIVKLLTLKSSGATIAKKLGPADDPLDALARLELGKKNFIVTEGPKGGKLVLLKNCLMELPLKISLLGQMKPSKWSNDSTKVHEGVLLYIRSASLTFPPENRMGQ